MSKQQKKSKNTLKTAKRLMKYVTGTYKGEFIAVIFCIIMCSIATISVSLSMRYLLDDYIIPLIGQASPDFSGLYGALITLACIFLLGIIASFIYSRLMVKIGQGVLKRVRDEMFEGSSALRAHPLPC